MEGLSGGGALPGIGLPASPPACAASQRDRNLILSFLEGLGTDPTKRGDYKDTDEVGRPVQIKIIGKYALTYWADHAVKEVKVVRIENADRT